MAAKHICPSCAKVFPLEPSRALRVAEGKAVFCSRDCQKAGKAEEVTCSRDGCDEVFRAPLSRIKASVTGRLFHTRECALAAGLKPRTGRYKSCELPNCGEKFWVRVYRDDTARFCSPEHRDEWQARDQVEVRCARPGCGEVFLRRPSQTDRKWHSRECYNLDRYEKAQGHRKIDEDGYVIVRVGDRYLREHRVIAARVIGRELLRGVEEVHHLNGNRADNRTDGPFLVDEHGRLRSGNLEIWSTSQPKGQAIGPKVAYAKEILALYEPGALREDGQV